MFSWLAYYSLVNYKPGGCGQGNLNLLSVSFIPLFNIPLCFKLGCSSIELVIRLPHSQPCSWASTAFIALKYKVPTISYCKQQMMQKLGNETRIFIFKALTETHHELLTWHKDYTGDMDSTESKCEDHCCCWWYLVEILQQILFIIIQFCDVFHSQSNHCTMLNSAHLIYFRQGIGNILP